MRNIEISVGEYYHIYNRGVNKERIFNDPADYARFLFVVLHLQSPHSFPQISRPVRNFVKHRVFDIDPDIIQYIFEERYVELVCFCLMPNHFHLILKELKEGGIARFMQRVLDGYSKYYNTKYQKSGHVLQGPYQAVRIANNTQLLYLSTYIHRNVRELPGWKDREHAYAWSSYQDFIKENRWGSLLQPQIVLEQFTEVEGYENFARTSTAKLLAEELKHCQTLGV